MSDSIDLNTDALSGLLQWLRLKAEVYVHTDFQGCWAVDTSGSRNVPFHLVHRGICWLHIPGEEPRLLSVGDLVVFPHDSKHYLSSEIEGPELHIEATYDSSNEAENRVTGLTCGYFEFENKANWPLLDNLPSAIVLELSDTSRLANTRTLIQLLISELQLAEPGGKAAVDHLAHVLFIHILRSQLEKGVANGLLKALFEPKIGKALKLIHNSMERNWTLESLAHEIGMSRSVFANEFKRLTGFTAITYLLEWRMAQAKELLQTTELSIIDISERCGYQSDVAFRKSFKKITGQTPASVRRNG